MSQPYISRSEEVKAVIDEFGGIDPAEEAEALYESLRASSRAATIELDYIIGRLEEEDPPGLGDTDVLPVLREASAILKNLSQSPLHES